MKTATIIICVLLGAAISAVMGRTPTTRPKTSPHAPPPTLIYFGTDGGGIKSYSLTTSEVSTVVDSSEDLEAIAYDSVSNQIYYCSQNQISRANVDGTGNQALQSNMYFVGLNGIACDWVTGNLYAVSSTNRGGSVYVCNASSSTSLVCTSIFTRGKSFYGIAIDSLRGGIFIGGPDGVHRANMDGSNFTTIVAGYGVAGVTVDPYSDRLYWASYSNDIIASSFRNGSGIETIVQLPNDAQPWGVTKVNELIYWGDYNGGKIQRSTITGENATTVYDGTSHVEHLTLVPSQDEYLNDFRSESFSNPCEGQGCSHICVLLEPKSFRCLCPEGWHLAEDRLTCVDTIGVF